MICGLNRVYTEQARVHTESIQSDLRNPTQSLHRLIQHPHRVYTDWFRVYTESTQSDLGSTQSLHSLIKHLDKVYTDQFRVYAESSQSLYRGIQLQIFTESTQSRHWAMQIYTASIKSDLGIIESLSRASQSYIPHGVKGSTHSWCWLYRIYCRIYCWAVKNKS